MNKFGMINITAESNEAQVSPAHEVLTRTAPEVRLRTEDKPLTGHNRESCIKSLNYQI